MKGEFLYRECTEIDWTGEEEDMKPVTVTVMSDHARAGGNSGTTFLLARERRNDEVKKGKRQSTH